MSGDSMLIAYRLIQSLWPPFKRPRRYARMVGQVARGEQRFYTIHSTLPDDLIVQHLLGPHTYATPLIGLDGEASAWAIDIDTGGPPMLIAALIAAAERGIQAFAITSRNRIHNGGHVWALYSGRHDPARLHAQAKAIKDACGLPKLTELWPNTHKSIRLPFGTHRWSKRRGTLILQTGLMYDLDIPLTYALGLRTLGILHPFAQPELPLAPPSPPTTAQAADADPFNHLIRSRDVDSAWWRTGAHIGWAEQLERLAPWRCDTYAAWIAVGMALYELGDDGLRLWENWSHRSARYQAGACQAKWRTFSTRPGGVTLASLAYWSMQDTTIPKP